MDTERRNAIAGTALVLHGLAHALPATNAGSAAATSLFQPPWALACVAMLGFVGAGFGLMGVAPFRRHVRPLALWAAVASLALLVLFWAHPVALVGALLDAGVIALVGRPGGLLPSTTTSTRAASRVRRALRAAGHALALAAFAWLGVVSLARPWQARWGSTDAEMLAALPGDAPLDGTPTYWLQHAVTIRAPAEAVWPWLAQLGTDRGGFYSHEWLENLFGAPVRNAERVHPEWQDVRAGGFVQALPAGRFGLDHPVGWRVQRADAPRVLVLEDWGAFVLVAQDANTTRFIVRTRAAQAPGAAGLLTAWAGLFVFEPAHFVMQRAMLLGIKRRAERDYRLGIVTRVGERMRLLPADPAIAL